MTRRVTKRERIAAHVANALRRHDLSASPQALASLVETVANSEPEFVGDTDTLLAGLLLSGSYTVDVLGASGVDLRHLRRLTLRSIVGRGPSEAPWKHEKASPIESFFEAGASKNLINEVRERDGRIEASDLLRFALDLSENPDELAPTEPVQQMLDLRTDAPAETSLMRALELRVAELIVFAVGFFAPGGKSGPTVRSRRAPISSEEDWELDRQLGISFRGMTTEELEWLIAAVNGWFVNRSILTSPPALALAVVDRLSKLLFGPEHFARSGGNLSLVDHGLELTRRLVPARDLPMMALFSRGGRVHAGHFTYRDTVLSTPRPSVFIEEIEGVRIYSPRPVPLLSASVLSAFEQLVSRSDVREAEIQAFLVEHPQILTSLGYATARPHICLREPDARTLVPDFLLELPGGCGFDILDLKLPQASPVAANPYLRASAELVKALAQLRKYAKFFDNAENRRRFERIYGLSAFKPEIIVVMGRASSISERDDRLEIAEQIGSLRLIDYDELLEYAATRVIDLPADSSASGS